MTRNQKIKTAMAGCALIAAAALILALSGVFSGGAYSFADNGKYLSGETDITEPVRNLDVAWTAGKVTVVYQAGSTVSVRESCREALSEDRKLRWWLDGDTLRIRYMKSGLRLFDTPEKELTLMLPEGTALKEVNIGATSGNLEIPDLTAETLRLETTSGDISAGVKAETVRLGATSGDIRAEAETAHLEAETTSGSQDLTLKGSAETVKAGSTSGSIALRGEEARKIEAGSTSGNLIMDIRTLGEADLSTTSGGVTFQTAAFAQVKIGSTSGSVTAKLPSEPGFTAKIGTTSGSVDNSMALAKNGDSYTCGDGSGRLEIGTTSGNIRLDALQE